MTTLLRRLAAVEQAMVRMPPRVTPVDLSCLTDAERADLAAIEARYGHLLRRPDGRLDLSVVSDVDLEIMAGIARRLVDQRGAA